MIQLDHINFGFGGRKLMEDLSLHVRPLDRIGIVGPNGSGKTTLMRIIAGELGDYDGVIKRRKGAEFGLLRQEGIPERDSTVFDAAMEPFAGLIALEREIQTLYSDSASAVGDDKEKLLKHAGGLQHQLESGGGFDYRARTAEVLHGLGFSKEDFDKSIGALSGGWKMRVALAVLLLQRPEVLLLDEPTNHLDLPAITWFDSFLQTYPGAVVVISHDRWFLDRVVKRIGEIYNRKLDFYDGNYSFYEAEKEKRQELLLKRITNQQREIEKTEKFIERFRYKATKAKSVQSRIKQLEKIERIEAPERQKTLKFSFKTRVQSGREVMALRDVSKSYGARRVLEHVNLTVMRGDRLAIIGANGLGKSTLIRVLAGRTEFCGDRKVGHNVKIQYFAQDQLELLDPNRTVLEEASRNAGGEFEGNSIRRLLGIFLFSGDDVEKKVGVLSGGEKSRLLLAGIMANPANFLLLDEPMNHLDPPSRAMLEEVLMGYDGALCFVSHDRRFINRLATRIVEFTSGGMREYIGNYEDYERQKALRESSMPKAVETGPAAAGPDGNQRKVMRRERAQVVAERSRILKPIKVEIAKHETEIHELEALSAHIETQLADPELYKDADKIRSLPQELKAVKSRLDDALARWETLSRSLEEKEKQFEFD